MPGLAEVSWATVRPFRCAMSVHVSPLTTTYASAIGWLGVQVESKTSAHVTVQSLERQAQLQQPHR